MRPPSRPPLHLVRADGTVKPRNPRSATSSALRKYWLEQYLAMGPTRTLRRLSELPSRGQGTTERTPHLTTLKRWSTEDDWSSAAERFDEKVNARAEAKTIEKMATDRAQREDTRIQLSLWYQSLILSLASPVEVIDEPLLKRTGERRVIGTRPRTLADLDTDDILKIQRLHRIAEHTQLLIDGKPTERISVEGGDAAHPVLVERLPASDVERLYTDFEQTVAALNARVKRRAKKARGA